MSLAAPQKAFFLLALRYRGAGAPGLFDFFSGDQAGEMRRLAGEIDLSHRAESLREAFTRELKKIGRLREPAYLKDLHNEWLVETLKWESPSVISLILRYLPADRVRAVLELLPHKDVEKLPALSRSFKVPALLVEAIRERFEAYFRYPRVPDPKNPFAFESLCFLSAANLARLFFELGYQEIALGLVTLPAKTQAMILGRLLPEDRLRVEYYLEKGASQAGSQRVRRAQVHVISKEVDPRRPKFFVKELGFLIFAKAMLPKDLADLEIIKKKFSLHEAMVLQRLVEKNLDKNNEASVLSYREDVIRTLKAILEGK